MGKQFLYFGLIGCAFGVAATAAYAGPSKADLEKALSACPPGQSEGSDGLCTPSQGDQMGYDFIPQGDTAPGGTQTATVAKPAVRHMARVEAPVKYTPVVTRGLADLQMNFPNNSSTLTSEDRKTASLLSEVLQEPAYSEKLVEIGGHTNATGSDEHNQVLSQQRADSVKQFLVDAGVPADRLKAVGYGSSDPIAGTDPVAGENRRVMLTVLGSKQP